MLARRFLWIIAIIVFSVIAAAFAYALFGQQLLAAALVPTVDFTASPQDGAPSYATPDGWDAHPALPHNPARWTPAGYAAAPKPLAAVFFVSPTAYLGRDRWNMPFGDSPTNARIALYLQGQASALNGVGEIWAPRYRQAAFGAFLTAKPDAARAIDLAFADVVRAWQAFLAAQPPGRPIILAAHSQGSLHLLRLLKEHIAGTPIAKRIIVVYAIGWPISIEADLPALGLPACDTPEATGCIIAWQSFAEPADPSSVREIFDATTGYTGLPRRATQVLCTNPLLGRPGDEAVLPAQNLGSLVPGADLASATLVAGRVGARCVPSGVLSIGPPPDGFGSYVLPGNNYHVYDYALFWANLRADVEARANAWQASRPAPAPAPRKRRQ